MNATDANSRELALAAESARIAELQTAIRRRHRLIHELAGAVDSNGQRLYSNRRIARIAGMTPQAIGDTLSRPAPPKED